MPVILDNLLPIFLLLGLGALLKRLGLVGGDFFSVAERLVYFVFFPALLFYKIGAPAGGLSLDATQALAVIITVALTFLVSLAVMRPLGVSRAQAGAFGQTCYRFNTYIGMAVIVTSLGPDGVTNFALLIGLVIPFINLLAVGALIWFGSAENPMGRKLYLAAKAVVLNPLILACLAGMAWAAWMPKWPVFVDNTLGLLSAMALPMALIVIGGSLGLEKLKGRLKPALAASGIKLLIKPLIGWGVLTLMGVSGLSFSVAMVFFALPTSPASYILSSQLGSDADLAAAIIVLSTLVSFVTLSILLLILV